jgi:hypothetical protein
MNEVTTIGIDLAKSVFQVHGVSASGAVVIRRQLRRVQVLPFFKKQPRCLVGMEACATAHHRARQLMALGHEMKLMPPRYVKPYVKRGKNDAADAEAIYEAVTRPTMRFVAMKSTGQQSVLMLHRTRELLVRQRVSLGYPLSASHSSAMFREPSAPARITAPSISSSFVGSPRPSCSHCPVSKKTQSIKRLHSTTTMFGAAIKITPETCL